MCADRTRARRPALALALCVLPALGGCVAVSDAFGTSVAKVQWWLGADGGATPASIRRVADEMIGVFDDLPALAPLDTTVQVVAPASDFGQALVDALIRAGYSIERVAEPIGTHRLRYRERASRGAEGRAYTYRASIGPVDLERDYREEDTRLVASSRMRIRGVEALEALGAPTSSLASALSRGARGLVSPPAPSAFPDEPVSRTVAAAERRLPRSARTERNAYLTPAAPAIRAARTGPAPEPLARAPNRPPVPNVGAGAGRWTPARRVALRFGAGAGVGPANRRALERLTRDFDANLMRVVIRSCSTAGALPRRYRGIDPAARARTVAESLVHSGLAMESIRIDRCGTDAEPPADEAVGAVTVTLERRGSVLRG